MRHVVIIVLAIFSSAGACSYGKTVEQLAFASSARGVNARVTTGDALVAGELLQVQDTGLLLLTGKSVGGASEPPDCRVRLVPFALIRASEFEELGSDYQIAGPQPGRWNLERLRLVSRFPHGLAPELLEQLLETCGQTEVAGVEP